MAGCQTRLLHILLATLETRVPIPNFDFRVTLILNLI